MRLRFRAGAPSGDLSDEKAGDAILPQPRRLRDLPRWAPLQDAWLVAFLLPIIQHFLFDAPLWKFAGASAAFHELAHFITSGIYLSLVAGLALAATAGAVVFWLGRRARP